MIDIDEAYSIIEEKLDKMTPTERALYLKKMGFKFNSTSKGFRVRASRTTIRRGRQRKASPIVRVSKKLAKKTYTGLEMADKKSRNTKKTNT